MEVANATVRAKMAGSASTPMAMLTASGTSKTVAPTFFTLLKSGGCLHLATDWQDYAEKMSAELLGDSRYLNRGDDKGYSPKPSYRPKTRFENRGIRLGHGVWDLIFEKK